MRLLVTTFAVVIGSALAGCHIGGPVYSFEPTSAAQPAKPVNCAFQVASRIPDPADYDELGVLDARRTPSTSLAIFKNHVRTAVCQAGGDLVVGEVNGYGYYVRAIVFRRTTKGAPATPPTLSSGTNL